LLINKNKTVENSTRKFDPIKRVHGWGGCFHDPYLFLLAVDKKKRA
jgi:hypothetical protein